MIQNEFFFGFVFFHQIFGVFVSQELEETATLFVLESDVLYIWTNNEWYTFQEDFNEEYLEKYGLKK
jgi:hypothetical protein